jgi:TonB family protein
MRILPFLLPLLLSSCIVYLPPPQIQEKKITRSYQPCLSVPACEILITDVISNNWFRPSDARNGIEVEILLNLNSDGGITSIQVVKQSGSQSFDMSTLSAITKSAPFSELKGLGAAEFDKWYRKRRIIFSPEDLGG